MIRSPKFPPTPPIGSPGRPATHRGKHERVLKFMTALRAAQSGDEQALITAGECMFGAHDSYKAQLSSLDRRSGFPRGLRARTRREGRTLRREDYRRRRRRVAVSELGLGQTHSWKSPPNTPRRIGVIPDIFEGTSPGSMEFGPPLLIRRNRLEAIRGLIWPLFAKPSFPIAGLGTRHSRPRRGEGIVSVVGPDGIAACAVPLSPPNWKLPASRKSASSSSRVKTNRAPLPARPGRRLPQTAGEISPTAPRSRPDAQLRQARQLRRCSTSRGLWPRGISNEVVCER